MCVIAGSQGCVQQRLNFQVRPDEMAVSQTARFYIYGKGAVSKSTFEDPHFRKMTQAYYVAGGGSGKAPYLTRHGLVKYLDAEFALMLKFTKFAAESLFEYVRLRERFRAELARWRHSPGKFQHTKDMCIPLIGVRHV